MTNGCFDILHAGHVAYLEQAKSLGDMLIVAVNSDESVQRLKGPTRPIVNLEQRMAVLSGLASVDWVVSFDDDTPRALIAEVLPDILVKGGDYQPEEIAGYAEVVANGGEVRILCFKDDCSTSGIVKKIISTSEEEGKFERQNCK
jgi:D-beta-D-heptose 7-phosphate kinase/D-beta-D-heptose 1-phosphate adenosyltransferase